MSIRLSTNMLFERGTTHLLRNQSELYNTQNQISTGRKILTPQDDPVGAVRVLEVTQSRDINQQYIRNQGTARSQIGVADGYLDQLTDLLQEIRSRLVEAGNVTYTDQERGFIAQELGNRYQLLLGIANAQDGEGRFLFSGFQGSTQPFASTASGVTYNGDEGQRLLQVQASRQLAVSNSGSEVFMQIANGNGTFVTSHNTANTGNGVVSTGSLTGSYSGDSYRITFTGPNTYDILNVTTATPVSVGNTYSSGQTITGVPGVAFDITGAPATGDQFDIVASSSQNMFATIQNVITALSSATTTNADRGTLGNVLAHELQNLDQAMDNVLRVRADVGTRLGELDALSSGAGDLDLQYQQTLSNLQDLDYTEAISNLSKQQMVLEAAQASFVRVTGLSLFDYLR